MALQKGNENLARQALEQKKTSVGTANMLKVNFDYQSSQIDTLKRNLIAFESKFSEVKTKKDMLKARLSAANAKEQLKGTVGRLETSSAMGAFERMEEKVLLQEARAREAQALIGSDLESQFAALESGSGVDDELAALKAQMSLVPATSPNPQLLPPASGLSSGSKPNQVVDSELEQLKKQLDQL